MTSSCAVVEGYGIVAAHHTAVGRTVGLVAVAVVVRNRAECTAGHIAGAAVAAGPSCSGCIVGLGLAGRADSGRTS